ncbi:MAG: 30S ribosome-binding factor RbfA [Ignavibacteria bacterium]|jgi:ribosome-binding factor A|nr:30S ribosome-binding factor RbfA [Ignavibacteria bacterium]
MSIRTEKVAEEIKHKLNVAMAPDLQELNLGLVTISKVIVSPDLKIAKAYLSFLGNKLSIKECLKLITERKPHIRFLLGKQLTFRYTPDLLFFHDDTIEYADHIEKILKSIKKPDTETPSEDTTETE